LFKANNFYLNMDNFVDFDSDLSDDAITFAVVN
jgi:hypothetical protein